MATNLVSNITQVLSSDLVARITSSLGLDRRQVEKALQAGIPSLLARQHCGPLLSYGPT